MSGAVQIAAIYASGAVSMAIWLLTCVRPRTRAEWIGAAGICFGWPLFIVWAMWPEQRK